MGSGDDADVVSVKAATGADVSQLLPLGASKDQRARLREDVERLRAHPLIVNRAVVGGFSYDVDTGELTERRPAVLRRRSRRRPAR